MTKQMLPVNILKTFVIPLKGGDDMKNSTLIQQRKSAGLTPSQVAKKVGLTDAGYRNYERLNRVPNVIIGNKIADVLGTTSRKLWPTALKDLS